MNVADYASLLGSYGINQTDLVLLGIILFLVLLISMVMRFRKRYSGVARAVGSCSEELKKHQRLIDFLEGKIRKYESTSTAEELEHWSQIEDELRALADLPRIEDAGKEVILRTHIAQSRKDYVDVSATNESVIITINDGKSTPVNVIYGIPAVINPSKLTITYKGNTLEVHAPKEPPREEKEE